MKSTECLWDVLGFCVGFFCSRNYSLQVKLKEVCNYSVLFWGFCHFELVGSTGVFPLVTEGWDAKPGQLWMLGGRALGEVIFCSGKRG